MVVVASPNYDVSSTPAVVRIQNAAGSSFEVRVDAAGPNAVGSMDVYYIVMEEGVYDEPGFKLEAVKYNSTLTDENNSIATVTIRTIKTVLSGCYLSWASRTKGSEKRGPVRNVSSVSVFRNATNDPF